MKEGSKTVEWRAAANINSPNILPYNDKQPIMPCSEILRMIVLHFRVKTCQNLKFSNSPSWRQPSRRCPSPSCRWSRAGSSACRPCSTPPTPSGSSRSRRPSESTDSGEGNVLSIANVFLRGCVKFVATNACFTNLLNNNMCNGIYRVFQSRKG